MEDQAIAIVLVGTLDTKGSELGFVRDLLIKAGGETLVVDAGSQGSPTIVPNIGRDRVFEGVSVTSGDRGDFVAAAAQGVARVVSQLHREGRVDGVLAIGGSAGTTIGTAAMRALPFGVPKLMVSTLASGQVRPFVGGSDILMHHSVADVAGLNRLTRTVLANAAYAMLGMVTHRFVNESDDRPVIGATMFGVTTPCVDHARKALESKGVEVIVFHATGVGGQAMEGLARDGQLAGVLDLTTTELADELVGGVLSAGPDRLEAAGRKGIPQVVSVGALDMVNFGPRSTVPEKFAHRRFHIHNANVTLMRTTPEENGAIGARMAEILGRATGPVVVMLPLGGVSAIDVPGGPFHDPEADAALFDAIREGLAESPHVRLVEREHNINSPEFAQEAADLLLELLPREVKPR